jgi:ATP-dependent DNA helicase RecG
MNIADEVLMEPWIDEEASRRLPILCAQGEGQTLEFMKSYPEQARDLAKEIAAFATSNAGTILLGVDNDGSCAGMPLSTAAQRDALLRRLEGVCNGVIKPSITPSWQFARSGEHIVLVLNVPKGSQPIYYVGHVPYMRHLTSSRPAEPHEVIELVEVGAQPSIRATESVEETPDKRTQFLAELMQILGSIVIFDGELEQRNVNPWLEQLRAQFGDAASRLRETAAEQIAVDERFDERLLDIADTFDQFAKLRIHLGSHAELRRAGQLAMAQAQNLLNQIAPEVIRHVPPRQLEEQLRVLQRQLNALLLQTNNARKDGSTQEVQAKASDLGRRILNVARYGVDRLGPNLKAALNTSGHLLHLSETEQLYLDGGVSMMKVADDVKTGIGQFLDATQSIIPD